MNEGWHRQAIYNAVRQAVLYGMREDEIDDVVARARLDAEGSRMPASSRTQRTEDS